jgi:PAS domain S-box-containing protein
MKIQTKLVIMAVLSILAIAILSIFLYLSSQSLSVAFNKNDITNQINTGLFQRRLFLDEYLIYFEDRPHTQWLVESGKLTSLVKDNSQLFSKVSEKAIINNLLGILDESQTMFTKLTAIIKTDGISTPLMENVEIANDPQVTLLSNQLISNSQEAIPLINQLLIISAGDANDAMMKMAAILTGFVVLTLIIVITILDIVWLSAVLPLIRLKEATSRVAALDFTTTTTTTTTTKPSNDEVGQLTQAFNGMVEKLKKSYVALKNSNIAIRNVFEDLNVEKSKVETAKAKDDAILASIGDGLVATDKDGRIIAINDAAEEMFGYKNTTLIGKKFYDAFGNKDTEGKPVPLDKRPISVALATGKKVVTSAVTPAYYYVRRDGTDFPVAITVTPIIFEGKITGVIDIFRDISKERDVDKAKTEFVSLASHQLRTPLSVVGWYSEMLSAGDAGKLTAKQKEYLDEIYKGNRRMVNLVNALLNVSRLELGTFAIEPEPTNISALVESIINEQKLSVNEKKLSLSTTFAKDIPVIESDPKLLRLVFQNLLSNAIKYSPIKGKIEISVSLKGKDVLFAISDNGIGIPESQAKEIFTKLYRADNARKKDAEGTGLGLYIAKSIIDHAGGKIWFDSVEGRGSTFYVALPLTGMKKKAGTKPLA